MRSATDPEVPELGPDPVIGGYACHTRCLSRMAVYAESVSVNEARAMVQELFKSATEVADEDIRIKTLYPWDLDMERRTEKILMAAYWTKNYRRSKSEDRNRTGLFLCASCQSVFPQVITEKQVLCEGCRASRS